MIEIIDCEQNTREWELARCGMPTASAASKVLAQGRKGEDSKVRRDYLYQLADEVIYQSPAESYTNENMERGKLWEAQARSIYALENDCIPEQVGFVKNHSVRAGCSPDSFIGTEGILQIKTSFPRLWVHHLIHGTYPLEHKPQIQTELWLTARAWTDLMIYWPHRQPYIIRIERDDEYINELLGPQFYRFNHELDTIVAAMRTKLDLEGTLRRSVEAAQ
jgi:hypothetical protein